jgi:Neuraminidase (sialidase)
MQIVATGILSRAEPGTARAALTFPSVLALADGALLATLRAGSTKDAADEAVELYRSEDGGRTWRELRRLSFDEMVGGARGTLKVCYLTELASGRLIAAAMWIDRTTYPGQPLFNPATEGCLPMSILLAESYDAGATWTSWRAVPLPDEIGPASLTSPILKLADGTLVMSIETNKHYHDTSRWFQRVVLFHSRDGGQTWGAPVTAGQDPSGRIFNWDQRLGLAPDGKIGAFVWTYDSATHRYLNIHRRISADGGRTWSRAEDLGFADQAGRPAVLPDGRVALPWVDRFGSRAIRARLAPAIDAAFDPANEVVLYTLDAGLVGTGDDSTGALLADMSLWTFGLPYAEALPDGDILIVYYAGGEAAMDIRWARLRV